jgi:hypothetical protein
VRRRGSHILYTIGSQIAVRFSALPTCRPLPTWKFLVLISVNIWVPKLLKRKRYYILFLIPVFAVQVTMLVQCTYYNIFSKILPSTSAHFATLVRTWSAARLVTDWAVTRRRIGKYVPTNPHPKIEGRPLLGNRPVNTHHSKDCATIERLFSIGSASRSYLEDNWRYRSQPVWRRGRIPPPWLCEW